MSTAESEAVEVRLELSTGPADDACSVSLLLDDGWRLVARFDGEPDVDLVGEKLRLFADSFKSLGQHVLDASPRFDLGPSHDLDATLETLRARTGALRAIVIDGESPVLWGSSDGAGDRNELKLVERLADLEHRTRRVELDLAALLASSPSAAHASVAALELDPAAEAALVRDTDAARRLRATADREEWQRLVLTARAVAPLRQDHGGGMRAEHGDDFGFMTRAIGGIYWLVLVFDGPFSELHTVGTLLRAAPVIEALIAALPPVDPGGGGGKVIALPRRKG